MLGSRVEVGALGVKGFELWDSAGLDFRGWRKRWLEEENLWGHEGLQT